MVALYWAVVLLAGLACTSAELGSLTSVEEHPSIAQVESRAGVLWLQHCAASVLTSYHVLSTASCFSGTSYADHLRRIRAGTSYRGTEGVVAEVSTVYIHPDYNVIPDDGNIAVVRLVSALPLGPTIQQAPILGRGIELPTGLTVQLVSWGTTTEGGVIGDNNLYQLDLYTVDNDACLEIYFADQIITENMVCVGLRDTYGRDLDSRDEGAPLYYQGTVVGLVAFGVSHGEDLFPIVNTAIGSYTQWIIETAMY